MPEDTNMNLEHDFIFFCIFLFFFCWFCLLRIWYNFPMGCVCTVVLVFKWITCRYLTHFFFLHRIFERRKDRGKNQYFAGMNVRVCARSNKFTFLDTLPVSFTENILNKYNIKPIYKQKYAFLLFIGLLHKYKWNAGHTTNNLHLKCAWKLRHKV